MMIGTYLPAAPGTYALRIGGDLFERRTVVGWSLSAEGIRPLVAGKGGKLARLWLDSDAVEHPDGRIESLSEERHWSTLMEWFEDVCPP